MGGVPRLLRLPVARRLLTALCKVALVAYRRWVSPWKGYRCAFAAAGRGPSCSTWALRLVEHGRGWALPSLWPARQRRCALAYAEGHRSPRRDPNEEPRRWRRGEPAGWCSGPYPCDLPCDVLSLLWA